MMREENKRIQDKATMLTALNIEDLEQTAQDVMAAVPPDKSIATLLSTVELLAQKYNLNISDMSVEGIAFLAGDQGKPVIKPEGNSLTETITLQGDLSQLRNFLFDCVRVRRLLRVKDMVLTSMLKSDQMAAKLTIEVFYLPFPQSIGKPSDVVEPFSQKELATLEKVASYPIMYVADVKPSSDQTPSVAVELPTVPVVMDPFSPFIPVLISSPTPMATPTPIATISATLQ